MNCPRCKGCIRRVELITEEETIEVTECLICGFVFGEAILDAHRALMEPPAPRPDVLTPIWDPEHCRLKLSFETLEYDLSSPAQPGDFRQAGTEGP